MCRSCRKRVEAVGGVGAVDRPCGSRRWRVEVVGDV